MSLQPQLIRVPIASLRFRPRNPNVMSEEQFASLVGRVKDDGELQPVLIRPPHPDDPVSDSIGRLGGAPWWEIIDGAHRVKAALEAGLTEIDAIVIHCNEEKAAALQISMNRLRGDLDLAAVARELALLAESWSLDQLTSTGFDQMEINALLDSVRESNERDLLDGAEVPIVSGPASDPEQVYKLELEFTSREILRKVKRALKKRGDGDSAAGLLAILDDMG